MTDAPKAPNARRCVNLIYVNFLLTTGIAWALFSMFASGRLEARYAWMPLREAKAIGTIAPVFGLVVTTSIYLYFYRKNAPEGIVKKHPPLRPIIRYPLAAFLSLPFAIQFAPDRYQFLIKVWLIVAFVGFIYWLPTLRIAKNKNTKRS